MSGDDIPYQLRPNKFIDRKMFLELLSRLVMSRGPEKYIYVSMGGRHLIDHHAIYNKLGIRALFSFDMSSNEILRQKLNRPTGDTICVEMKSADLPSRIDTILGEFPSKRNMIVWLDYTGTQRRAQFQEAIQTLVRLRHGDVFRITLNADPRTLNAKDEWRNESAAGPGEYRAQRLREQISEHLPTDVTSISGAEVPHVLARCVGLAVEGAQAQQPKLRFTPVLITSYSDGTRMLTVTCAVSEIDRKDSFPTHNFSKWKFACKGWTDVCSVYAPILSLREQYKLDSNLHRGAKRMLSALRFMPIRDDEAESLSAIESYRALHRYYPTFRNIED